MKQVSALLLATILMFIAITAFAVEIDYQLLSDEELQQIFEDLNAEIERRKTEATTKAPTDTSLESAMTNQTDSTDSGDDDEKSIITTADDLLEYAEHDIETQITNLQAQWDEILTNTKSYSDYKANVGAIRDFYSEVDNATAKLCLRIAYYAFDYAVLELNSGDSNRTIYSNLSDMYDVLYKDARKDIYDDVYDDLLKDMYDELYDGVLKKGKNDAASYDEWDDFRSEEYSLYDETRSSVYGIWDSTFSEIYSFWDNFRSYIYNDETQLACKTAIRFHKRLGKKSEEIGLTASSVTSIIENVNNILSMTFEPTPVDGVDEAVMADLESTLEALENEWKEISTEVDTFEKYVADPDRIEEFYDKIVETVEALCLRQRQFAIEYANVILQSDSQTKYRDLMYLHSSLYGDSRREILGATYNGILKKIHQYYYNGILKKGKKTASYSVWNEARSDEYSWWSDARSTVYSTWSDTYSDIYSFWSDLRSEVYSKDWDTAQKVIDKFQKKLDRKSK